jgi:hypothetical protein
LKSTRHLGGENELVETRILEEFASQVERTPEEVKQEIEDLMRDGNYSEAGALVVWKSNNKFALQSGKPQELKIRVLSREAPRVQKIDTGEQSVANIDVIYVDENDNVGVAGSGLWGDRSDIATKVLVNGTYKVVARIQQGTTETTLTAMELLEEIDDTEVPKIGELEKSGWELGSLSTIEDFGDRVEIFKGMIGRLIQSNDGTNAVIGFELSNPFDASVPITVWGGRGRRNPAPPEVQDILQSANMGDEVYVWAYVNERDDGTYSLNASGVFPQQA